VPDLAGPHQIGQGADGVLDRHLRVHPVLVVQIDVLGAEPLERPLDRGPGVVRVPVDGAPAVAAAVREQPELGRDHHLVPAARESPAEQLLVDERPVDLGRVEERHPQLDRAVDGADRLGVVGGRAGVERRHAHQAEADAGDVEARQRYVFHDSKLRPDGPTRPGVRRDADYGPSSHSRR
jgi:hypothetical protein